MSRHPIIISGWINTVILLAFGIAATAHSAGTDQPSIQVCLDRIDTFIATEPQHNESDTAIETLTKIADSCPGIPHLQHNLGVLKARNQQWEEAIEHFEASLALDPRAEQTYRSLGRIYRYRAVRAYRSALQSNSPEPAVPEFTLQDSSIRNFDDSLKLRNDKDRQTIKRQIHPLLLRWWRFRAPGNESCRNCYAENRLPEKVESADPDSGEKVSLNTQSSLPDYFLHASVKGVHVIIRDQAGQVYDLNVAETHQGWRIMNEQVLP